jgi:3-hydroxy-3-methylglutaryl CoA synthase
MLQPPVLERGNSLLITKKYGVVEVTEETLASIEFVLGAGIAQVVVGSNVTTRPLVPNEVSTTSDEPEVLRPTRTEEIYDSDCPAGWPCT